jgi:hypothetical protein
MRHQDTKPDEATAQMYRIAVPADGQTNGFAGNARDAAAHCEGKACAPDFGSLGDFRYEFFGPWRIVPRPCPHFPIGSSFAICRAKHRPPV